MQSLGQSIYEQSHLLHRDWSNALQRRQNSVQSSGPLPRQTLSCLVQFNELLGQQFLWIDWDRLYLPKEVSFLLFSQLFVFPVMLISKDRPYFRNSLVFPFSIQNIAYKTSASECMMSCTEAYRSLKWNSSQHFYILHRVKPLSGFYYSLGRRFPHGF